jgi:CRISPR-associated protein Csy2
MRRFLLIPHLKIHNANAMSSPYTIGFPAMTAWLGAIHALQRHLHLHQFPDIELKSVAISCHQFDLQTYKGPGDFVHSIIGTANPLDKDGSRPAFIEEARCHLEVSLLVELQGKLVPDDYDVFKDIVNQRIPSMKWASGDLLTTKGKFSKVEIYSVDEADEHDVKNLLKRLMLGYVLVERRDLMIQAMQDEGLDALDALLSYLKVMHRSKQDEKTDKVTWTIQRKTNGWLVPIAVGFQGISELGKAANQRDPDTPHRFAESVVTLGEFKMPHRIENLDDVLWQYHVDTEQNLYLCRTLTSSNLIGE